jgi:hypothetical protein
MEDIIKDLDKAIRLNLKAKVSPFYDNDGKMNGGIFKIYLEEEGTLVSQFIIEPMGGCRGVCVSKKVSIEPQFRGMGYGTTLCQFREKLAMYFDYSAMICSVVDGNIPQEKIMLNNGWSVISSFHNKRTGNQVNIFLKKL